MSTEDTVLLMRPVGRYSSSNTFSVNVGEYLPLTSNPSKLTNIKHTKGKYHHKFDCSYCSKPCICNPMIAFVLIILMLIIPASITIGGYYTVEEGMKMNDYADSFNIEGSCTVISADVIYVHQTCTRSYQVCSRRRLYDYDSSNDDQENCHTETETYDCSYWYTTVDYKVNEDTNSTIFPCDIGTEFNEEYSGVHNEYKKDQKRACYTNPSCDEIFTSTHNRHHTSAGWIYFGASLVFLVAICCLSGICYKCREELGNAVDKCCISAGDDCCDGVCCLCIEYKGYKEKKHEHYEYQWDKVMNDDDRFDYVMTNWMKKYGKYKYQNNGISVDIELIIYHYLY